MLEWLWGRSFHVFILLFCVVRMEQVNILKTFVENMRRDEQKGEDNFSSDFMVKRLMIVLMNETSLYWHRGLHVHAHGRAPDVLLWWRCARLSFESEHSHLCAFLVFLLHSKHTCVDVEPLISTSVLWVMWWCQRSQGGQRLLDLYFTKCCTFALCSVSFWLLWAGWKCGRMSEECAVSLGWVVDYVYH